MEWEEIPNFPQLVLPEAPLMPDAVLEVLCHDVVPIVSLK